MPSLVGLNGKSCNPTEREFDSMTCLEIKLRSKSRNAIVLKKMGEFKLKFQCPVFYNIDYNNNDNSTKVKNAIC